MGRCPECGRVISLHFPIHSCEPTANWRAENPGVFWVVKFNGQSFRNRYLGRIGGSREEKGRWNGVSVKRQRQAVRFSSFDRAEQAREREVVGGRIVRVRPKAKTRRGR